MFGGKLLVVYDSILQNDMMCVLILSTGARNTPSVSLLTYSNRQKVTKGNMAAHPMDLSVISTQLKDKCTILYFEVLVTWNTFKINTLKYTQQATIKQASPALK